MIKISKDEAMYLANHGLKFGVDLHRTYSKYKHYFMTTSPKAMNKLNKYRSSQIAK